MLYDTHQKFGKASGYLGIIVLTNLGTLPVITKGMRFTDTINVITLAIVAVVAATFGSEFPDCDSYGGKMKDGTIKKGSIPSQKHPKISKIFRFFGVKHRGKFSHDYVSLGLFFGSILYLVKFLGNIMIKNVSQGKSSWMLATQIFIVLLALELSREIANKIIYSKLKLGRGKSQSLMTMSVLVVVLGLMFLGGFFAPLTYFSISTAMKSTAFLVGCMKIFVIFTWIGAYSHLFADMMTIEGVWFAGIKLRPAGPLSKIPFIGKVLFSGFKTGSPYEDTINLVVGFLIIPLFLLSIVSLTGGDVAQLLRNLHIIG